ncbi:MAG: hypothetical protein QW097_01695 [archaeon]
MRGISFSLEATFALSLFLLFIFSIFSGFWVFQESSNFDKIRYSQTVLLNMKNKGVFEEASSLLLQGKKNQAIAILRQALAKEYGPQERKKISLSLFNGSTKIYEISASHPASFKEEQNFIVSRITFKYGDYDGFIFLQVQ